MNKYSVTVVNYLNSKPFIHGLESSVLMDEINLYQDFPASCAEKLLSGETDMAIVPVAIIPRLATPHIISNFCIGADGPVKTVCLFSEVPIEDITAIYLDYQSMTSVRLLQILCKEYWKVSPRMVKAYPGYTSEIKDSVAGVVIGDRAITFLESYPYVYDLAEIWKLHTGLPFVFAAWVANKPIEESFLLSFNQALSEGLKYRLALVEQYQHLNNSLFNTEQYLFENLSYDLDDQKKKAMQLFHEKMAELEGIELPEVIYDLSDVTT